MRNEKAVIRSLFRAWNSMFRATTRKKLKFFDIGIEESEKNVNKKMKSNKVKTILVLLSYLVTIESEVDRDPINLIPCTSQEDFTSSSPSGVFGRCVEKQHCLNKSSIPCLKECVLNPTGEDTVCCNVSMIIDTVLEPLNGTEHLDVIFPEEDIKLHLKFSGYRNPGCKYFDSKDPSWVCTDKGGSTGRGAVGGVDTKEGEYPWMAAVFRILIMGNMKFQCGGSLIHPNFVLTAAHCLDALFPIFYSVRIGAHNISQPANNITSEDLQVIQLYLHPNFSFPYNDIAILRIRNTRLKNVIPACLPRNSFSNNESEFLYAQMLGWGVTELGGDGLKSNISEILQVISISIKPTIECASNYSTALPDFKSYFPLGIPSSEFICAGETEQKINACHFDSGGPLFKWDSSSNFVQWVVIGVVSTGSATCGGDVPALFTRVTTHLDWIMSIVGKYPILSNDPQKRYN